MHTPSAKFSTLRPDPETRIPECPMQCTTLRNVEQEEGHHEREETSSFGEGETQNGVLEELTPERRVAGDTLDEGTEDGSDTDTSTSETNRGNTGTLDLGGSDHGGGGRLSNDATALDDVAAGVVLEGVADGAVHDEAVLGGLDADGGCAARVNGRLMELNGWGCNAYLGSRRSGWWASRSARSGRPGGRRRRIERWQPLWMVCWWERRWIGDGMEVQWMEVVEETGESRKTRQEEKELGLTKQGQSFRRPDSDIAPATIDTRGSLPVQGSLRPQGLIRVLRASSAS